MIFSKRKYRWKFAHEVIFMKKQQGRQWRFEIGWKLFINNKSFVSKKITIYLYLRLLGRSMGCWRSFKNFFGKMSRLLAKPTLRPCVNVSINAENWSSLTSYGKYQLKFLRPFSCFWKPIMLRLINLVCVISYMCHTSLFGWLPHEWPRQNFSLKCWYNFKQTSNENKEKYKLKD